jgi:hypothetical protein
MRTPIQAGKIKQTRSRYMSTNVILKEGIHCLLFVTLAQSYVSIHLEGMNVISLLLDIGHEMKKNCISISFSESSYSRFLPYSVLLYCCQTKDSCFKIVDKVQFCIRKGPCFLSNFQLENNLSTHFHC